MNDIYITLTGNVAAPPRQHTFTDGSRVTSLRVATRHRFFDKKTQEWSDGETVFFAVRCWRTLGDNVAQSFQVGHPVVVCGKLRIREFGPDGDRRFMPEVEASSIGHDLRWGVGAFSKPERSGGIGTLSRETRESLDESTQDWAMSGSTNVHPLTARQAPSDAGEADPALAEEVAVTSARWSSVSSSGDLAGRPAEFAADFAAEAATEAATKAGTEAATAVAAEAGGGAPGADVAEGAALTGSVGASDATSADAPEAGDDDRDEGGRGDGGRGEGHPGGVGRVRVLTSDDASRVIGRTRRAKAA